MNKPIATVLTIGFLMVDFLFFHDIFKPGESTSLAQYLTGLLSILIFALSFQTLRKSTQKTRN